MPIQYISKRMIITAEAHAHPEKCRMSQCTTMLRKNFLPITLCVKDIPLPDGTKALTEQQTMASAMRMRHGL